jgi:hypothetical protein
MLVGGVITTAVGLLLAVIALRQMLVANARRALLVATPTTPIASTRPGTLAEIEGMAGPSEQGLVVSPASGRQALWFQVEVWHMGGTPSVHYRAGDKREFWIQDRSGAYARILPERARVELPRVRYEPGQLGPVRGEDHTTYMPMSQGLLGWAMTVGGVSGDQIMVEERVIAPGERVLAQGLAERSPDGTLFLRSHREHELQLTTLGEHELVEVRRREGQLGLILLIVFSVVAAIGVVLAGVGWYVDL